MEANLVPGMTKGSSYYPKAHEIENNLSYDEVVGLMVSKGLSRVTSVTPLCQNISVHNDTIVSSA